MAVEIGWLNILSNIIIGLSYYIIAGSLFALYLVRRKTTKSPWILACFTSAIFACGTTYLINVLTFYIPTYSALSIFNVLTAIGSLTTAIMLPRIIKETMKLESPEKLMELNLALKAEIEHSAKVEKSVRESNHELSTQVQKLQNIISTQGWITERQMDLDGMKRVITDLRRQYARPD